MKLLNNIYNEVKEFQNDIIELKRRYNSITNDKNKGLITHEDATREINKISDSIIALLDSVENLCLFRFATSDVANIWNTLIISKIKMPKIL